MKHIIKVEVLENLPETRPLVAMDDNKNIKWLAKPYTLTFVNTDEDYNWNNPNNWDLKKVPSIIDTAIIDASVNISNKAKCNNLIIDSSDAIVSILPTGGLTVGKDGISGASIDNLILKAGTEGAVKGQTGYLRISPEYTGEMPEATVEFYSIAYVEMPTQVGDWQTFGYPMENDVSAKSVFSQSWFYSWNTATSEWENTRNSYVMQPFEGYMTSQYKYENGMLITFAGKLVQNENHEINLIYNEGDEYTLNLTANSFSAPIDITKFKPSDFINVEPEIGIQCTDSTEALDTFHINITTEEDIKAQLDAYGISYIIPSMQCFYMSATGPDAKLILDYERLVWNNPYPNIPLY